VSPFLLFLSWVPWFAFGTYTKSIMDGFFIKLMNYPVHPSLENVRAIKYSRGKALARMGFKNAVKFVSTFGLVHSLIYTDRVVLEHLASWLSNGDVSLKDNYTNYKNANLLKENV